MISCRENFYVKLITFLLFLCLKCYGDNYDGNSVPEDLVSDLYLKYKEAVSDDINNTSLRRLLKNSKQYEIHVKKLREVNGFKVHNLMIKENLRSQSDPLIYINNPVESKIPKAYISLEEFKNVLTDRIMAQRNKLNTRKSLLFRKTTKKDNRKEKTNAADINTKIRHINVRNKVATELESIAKTTKSFSVKIENTKLDKIIEATVTKVNTDSATTLNSQGDQELTENIERQFVVTSLHTENVLETTEILNVTKNKDIENKMELETEKSVSETNLENITKNVLVITKIDDDFNSTNKNGQDVIEQANTNDDLIITYEGTLQEESIKTVQTTTVKEKPRRKTTVKLSEFSKASRASVKAKRSTLGRPLVFMGNR